MGSAGYRATQVLYYQESAGSFKVRLLCISYSRATREVLPSSSFWSTCYKVWRLKIQSSSMRISDKIMPGATTVPRQSLLYLPSSCHLECLSLQWTFQTPREEPTSCQPCKNHIRRYINEGHDVATAQQMKDAILSHGGVKGIRVAVVEAAICETPEQRKIPGINKLNNFEFRNESVFTRGAYGIGEGSRIIMTFPMRSLLLTGGFLNTQAGFFICHRTIALFVNNYYYKF